MVIKHLLYESWDDHPSRTKVDCFSKSVFLDLQPSLCPDIFRQPGHLRYPKPLGFPAVFGGGRLETV